MLLLLVLGVQAWSCLATGETSNATLVSIEPGPLLRASPFIYRDRHYAIAGFATVNWFQANHICNTLGMALATVATEDQFLQLRNRVAINRLILKGRRFWLGGTNLVRRFDWTWLTNGLAVNYPGWSKDEPKYSSQPSCLLLDSNTLWRSAPCKEEHYFICENICPLDSFLVEIDV